MPNALTQRAIPGSVIDWQVDIDFRDFDVPHDAVPGEVENGIVFLGCRLQGFLCISSLCCSTGEKRLVVGNRIFPLLHQNAVVRLRDDLLIGGEYLRCILLVDIITDNRIQGQPQRGKE